MSWCPLCPGYKDLSIGLVHTQRPWRWECMLMSVLAESAHRKLAATGVFCLDVVVGVGLVSQRA